MNQRDILNFDHRLDSFEDIYCICGVRRQLKPESRLLETLIECKGFVQTPDSRYSIDYVMAVLLANLSEKGLIVFSKHYNKDYVRTDGVFQKLLPPGVKCTLNFFRSHVETEMGVLTKYFKDRSLINCPGPAFDYLMSFKPHFIEPSNWCRQYC